MPPWFSICCEDKPAELLTCVLNFLETSVWHMCTKEVSCLLVLHTAFVLHVLHVQHVHVHVHVQLYCALHVLLYICTCVKVHKFVLKMIARMYSCSSILKADVYH